MKNTAIAPKRNPSVENLNDSKRFLKTSTVMFPKKTDKKTHKPQQKSCTNLTPVVQITYPPKPPAQKANFGPSINDDLEFLSKKLSFMNKMKAQAGEGTAEDKLKNAMMRRRHSSALIINIEHIQDAME